MLGFVVAIGLPLFAALLLMASAVGSVPWTERAVARLTATVQLLQVAAVLLLAGELAFHWLSGQTEELVWHGGTWYRAGDYHFAVTLLLDLPGVVLALLAAVIGGLIGRFSVSYLHKEPGFTRFFALLLLFSSAMQLLVLAGSMDLLFAGWELVGLTSTLLIAFFYERQAPLRSALYAFVTYRVCDVGLLFGSALLHHFAHSAEFDTAFGAGHWPLGVAHLPPMAATIVALLLVLAAMGKSALFPASSWLPRAMEGPTPSSALFYGALSIHAGLFLLLRVEPLLAEAPIAQAVLVVLGLLTAQLAAMSGRVHADAKTSIAYAALAQVGVIAAEIGMGWYRVAIVHLAGHAVLRTWQLLRAPSALADAAQTWQAGVHIRRGQYGEHILPVGLQRWLYRAALERFWLDTLWRYLLVQPVLALGHWLNRWDTRLLPTLAVGPKGPSLLALRAGPTLLVLAALQAPAGLLREVLPWLSLLGLVVALYAALLALVQTDLRRFGGAMALAQSGLLTVGLASADAPGLAGVPVQLLAAALSVAGWLVGSAAVARRLGSTDSQRLGGLVQRAPLLAWSMLFFGLASVGLPGTLGFVGEDLLVHGVLEHHPWLAAGYVVTTALLAIGVMRIWFAAMLGPEGQLALPGWPYAVDATVAERRWLMGLAVPLVLLGLWPGPLVTAAAAWTAPLWQQEAAAHHTAALDLSAPPHNR
jgi:NADH:ubiquinone oxidoreductase subunit 5 (subunit L)/multisubunit Na+/H+ antiporter MnhA subunit